MSSSCCGCSCTADSLQQGQRGTLRAVLAINAVMFVVIATAALYGHTSALLSDSLDNLGDALTYGLSLYAVGQGVATKARVALFKGGLIFLAAAVVIGQVGYRLFVPALPSFEVMGVFSLAGLAANGLCLYLLSRHRKDDVNMSSVWECSRNDIVSNLSVLAAGGLVWLTAARWPDLILAALLAAFLLRSSFHVLKEARAELRRASEAPKQSVELPILH